MSHDRLRGIAAVTALALMYSGTVASLAAAARHDLLTKADRASFDALRRSLGGDSGLAVSPIGKGQPVRFLGTLRSVVAWSTSKVPVAMAVIDGGGKREHASDLRQAITASDNAAAERLWSSLGGGTKAAAAAQAEVRAAGDSHTRIESRRLRAGFTPFGQTLWSLTDQARFTAGMTCVSSGRQVLGLMGQVIPAHHWGLGVRSNANFKGGWGPGSQPGSNGGYIDRQMGTATVGGKQIAIAIATRPADGSHKSGTAHLTAIAKWVYSHVDVRSAPLRPTCG
jgi:hypothetical protein